MKEKRWSWRFVHLAACAAAENVAWMEMQEKGRL